jgi:hypothetical protein
MTNCNRLQTIDYKLKDFFGFYLGSEVLGLNTIYWDFSGSFGF